jgi:hypothetical protein
MGKRKGRRRHTEFIDVSAKKIAQMAHDRRLSPAQRRKAQTEEKERKLRNKQKRGSG